MILLLISFIESILAPFLLRGFGGRIISLFRFFEGFINALINITPPIESTFIEFRSPISLMGSLEEIFCSVGSSSFTN